MVAPLESVPSEVWARWRSDPDFRPPGGETLSEAGARVRAACEELFAVEGEGARGRGAVVVVSHVSPIKAATCWALGLGDQGAWRLYLATGSVTRIGWGADGPVLDRFNETPPRAERTEGGGDGLDTGHRRRSVKERTMRRSAAVAE